jgi:SecDF, P1 head subdomain
MTDPDDLQRRLPGFMANRAPSPQPGLFEALVRQTADLPQRRGRFTLAGIGWLVVGAAVAVVVLVAVVVFGNGLMQTPVAPGTHATPSATPEQGMTTISLPVPVQEKAIVEQAEMVFANRLTALGIGNFTASAGNDLRFTFLIPPSVDPADVDAVLHTAGRIEWLAWPDGAPTPNVGDPVPEGVVPLFDAASQIASVKLTTGHTIPQVPEVELTFGPVATEALAAYTSSHVGQALPLALDGRILTAPIIQSPLTAGDIIITAPSAPEPGELSAAALAAILKSGPVPSGWTMP